MDPTEDISDSVRAYVSKAITMETEVTENTIDHQEKINVNATHECTGLKDVKKTTNTSKLITKSTLTTHDENYNNNSDNTKQELQEVLTIEKVLDQTTQIETVSSSYETSKVIYASIHKEHFKDYSAVVVADTMTQKDLEATGQGTSKKPFPAATVPAEVYLEELVENLQSRKEMGKIMTVAASTRSRKESTSNQSVFTSNGVMFENSSKISQIEENVNSISTIDLSKLIRESPNVLVTPQDDKDSIGLSAADPNGKTISSSGSNSNRTSSSASICEQDLENFPTDSQSEPLPIATPPLQSEYEFGSEWVNKAKPFQKHSLVSQRDRGLIQKNESAESLSSLSRKLVLEIMELQHQTLQNNPSQNGEVRIRPRSIKAQTTKPFQRGVENNEVSKIQKMEKGHVDFATARKQWLKLEAISKTHSYRSVVKEQKNKTVTKYVTKIDDHPINKSKNDEAARPSSGSMFSEDSMQSKASKGMKTDEVECLRKSTNPNQEQAMEALQENDETVGNSDKKFLSDATDYSPCPEGSDSSQDDWTYGFECNNSSDPGFQDKSSCSPPMAREKPETPIEREICLSLKREESLRKARGLTKLPYSEKFVEIKTRPLNLQSLPSASSSKVKNNQFAEMQMQREILLERKREEDRMQERKVTGKLEENMIPEIEARRKFFEQKNPFQFPFPNKMLASPITTPATLLVVPPRKRGPSSNETKVSNVVILQNDLLTSDKDKSVNDAMLKLKYPNTETANVVILETPNLIIQRSSCYPSSALSLIQREVTLQNNPFFKLRSHGAQSIINQEIREVLHREEELFQQRRSLHGLRRASEESLRASSAVNNLPSGVLLSSSLAACLFQ
ncbi:uncharacterized protein LOC144598040 [Rhinoraja longicauda]